MTETTQDIPLLEALHDDQGHRLAGLTSWEQIACLGKNNIERLIQLTQETVHRQMAGGASSGELRVLADGITRLREIAATVPKKPTLPRFRVESFRTGDAVVVYLADSKGSIAPTDWVEAAITDVQKSHKREWVDGSPNGGYFWRCTATTAFLLFPDQHQVDFSTTEPRVLHRWEWEYLREAKQNDPRFLEIYVANAWRSWCPLWCLERDAGCAAEAMDMRQWLMAGSGPDKRLMSH